MARATHRVAAPLALAVLLLASCGEQPTTDDGPRRVTVGVLPIEGLEPFYIALNRGYFEEEGLEVVPQQGQGGAAIIPGVVSGDFQFGFSNNVSLLTASAQGLGLRVLTDGTDAPTEGEPSTYGFSLVVAPEDGEVQEADDLPGSTVAVNTLQNIGPVVINRSLEKRGIDPAGVEYVEVPFPEMSAALKQGDVDAAWLVEPFSTVATDDGAKTLLRPYLEAAAGRSIATWFTSATYAEEKPEITKAFTRALKRGIETAANKPQLARDTLLDYTKIPPKIAKRMTLSVFTTEVDPADFNYLSNLMLRYEFIKKKPDVDELLEAVG